MAKNKTTQESIQAENKVRQTDAKVKKSNQTLTSMKMT
jgi:hypothetical protein